MRILSMLLLSGSISLLVAQSQKASPVAMAPKNIPAQAAGAQEKLMEGMLVSVDQAKQTLVIDLRGEEYAFQVNSASSIFINNTPGTIENIVPGSGARVTYIRNGSGGRVIKTFSQIAAASKMAQRPTGQKPVGASALQAPAVRQATVPGTISPVAQPAVAPSPAAPAAVAPAPAKVPTAVARPVPSPVAPKAVAAPAAATPTPAAAAPTAPAPSPVAPRPVEKPTVK